MGDDKAERGYGRGFPSPSAPRYDLPLTEQYIVVQSIYIDKR